METWIFWVVLGLTIGILARWIVPGESLGGVAGDMTVGVVGGLAGGWLYHHFYNSRYALEMPLSSIVCAMIGAVVLLWLVRTFRPRPLG